MEQEITKVVQRRLSSDEEIELRAAAAVQARKDEEYKKDKDALIKALEALQKRTGRRWQTGEELEVRRWGANEESTKYSYPQIIDHALTDMIDSSTGTIARLHSEKKLKGAIENLQRENKLDEIPATLIRDVLATSERMTAAATTPASNPFTSSSVAPSSAFYRPLPSAGNKSNLGGTLGLGLGMFAIGGALTAVGIFMIIGKIATVSAGASSPLPPLAIPLLVVGGAALLASLIILAALAYKHAEKGNRFDAFTHSASLALKF